MDRNVTAGNATKASDQNYSTNAVNATAYTIVDTDKYDCIAVTTAGSASTITLPTASDNDNRIITIIKVDSGSGDVDITPEGSENINGYNAAFKLNGQWQRAKLKSDGSDWIILDCLGTLLEFTSAADVAAGGVADDTWYNPASHSLAHTPGRWLTKYKVCILTSDTATALQIFATLSTANNSESDVLWTSRGRYAQPNSEAVVFTLTLYGEGYLTVAANTTQYLNIKANGSGTLASLTTKGEASGTIISARRIA